MTGNEYNDANLLMPASRFQFEEFELDRNAYELRRGAQSVRLERIPFELLTLLVERRGQLVAREEIIERIWGKGVFHDTEHGINTAVRKIRQALQDDPNAPRFIVTVPAKGYRFVAPVEQVEPSFQSEPSTTPESEKGTASGAAHPARIRAVVSLGEAQRHSVDDVRLMQTVPATDTGFGTPVEIPINRDTPLRVVPTRQAADRSSELLKRIGVVAAVAILPVIGVAIWRIQPQVPTVINAVRISNDGKAKIPMNLPVTDGVHLYFIEGAPWTSGSGIAQMSAMGGEITRITTELPKVLAIYAISPDRSELLVASGVASSADGATGRSMGTAELWVQPLPAGTPYRVGSIYASGACWTPNGRQVVYADGHAIIVANKDGSEPRELAKVPPVVHALRFSPDGQRIRFQVNAPPYFDSSSIWEMDADGKNLHQVFGDWKQSPYQCCGNWSRDGNYYYFQAGRGGDQGIWAMPERRSIFSRAASPSRLISGPLRFSVPVPSDDGKRLFVVGEESRVELLRYDRQGRRFDSYLQGLSAGPFDFSPDGKWITYVSYPDMVLWRSRTDGTDKIQLTFPPVRAYHPRWSPDGTKIVFLDAQFYHPWRIRVLPSSGGTAELLVHADDNEVQTDPTWTPDGKSIVFAKSRGTEKIGIFCLDLDSGKAALIPGSENLFSARASPDGRYIAALASGQTKLLLFDTNTNQWSTLAEGENLGFNEWSHDGKYVYMRESSSGAAKLVRVDTTEHAVEEVVSLKDFPQVVDMYAAWFGLTPDDAPVLIRDRSVQEIYALELAFH